MLKGGKPERLFADRLRETIRDGADILDVGTSERFAKELRSYESWFDGKRYVAAGYRPLTTYGVYNCDCHQDIEEMSFAAESFDAVLCIEVLEHVANPFAAARELVRVLRPNGRLLVTTPFLYAYHGKQAKAQAPDHESYPDYWRYTHQGLQTLFKALRDVRVCPLDGPIEFRLGQFIRAGWLALPPVRRLLDLIDCPQAGRSTSRHLLTAVK